MGKKIKQLLENIEYNSFCTKKEKVIIFLQNFGINMTDLLNSIKNTDYDKYEDINYAFGKLNNVLNICNILRKEKIEKNHDTDNAIIMNLVSLAEAIYRLNKPTEKLSENLVKGFFKPVSGKLFNNIRFSLLFYEDKNNEIMIKKIEKEQKNIPAIIFYLIRNDYIHNGSFIGVFFKTELIDGVLGSNFSYSEKDNGAILLNGKVECNLTYNEFLSIFLEAFKLNLEKYLNNN